MAPIMVQDTVNFDKTLKALLKDIRTLQEWLSQFGDVYNSITTTTIPRVGDCKEIAKQLTAEANIKLGDITDVLNNFVACYDNPDDPSKNHLDHYSEESKRVIKQLEICHEGKGPQAVTEKNKAHAAGLKLRGDHVAEANKVLKKLPQHILDIIGKKYEHLIGATGGNLDNLPTGANFIALRQEDGKQFGHTEGALQGYRFDSKELKYYGINPEQLKKVTDFWNDNNTAVGTHSKLGHYNASQTLYWWDDRHDTSSLSGDNPEWRKKYAGNCHDYDDGRGIYDHNHNTFYREDGREFASRAIDHFFGVVYVEPFETVLKNAIDYDPEFHSLTNNGPDQGMKTVNEWKELMTGFINKFVENYKLAMHLCEDWNNNTAEWIAETLLEATKFITGAINNAPAWADAPDPVTPTTSGGASSSGAASSGAPSSGFGGGGGYAPAGSPAGASMTGSTSPLGKSAGLEAPAAGAAGDSKDSGISSILGQLAKTMGAAGQSAAGAAGSGMKAASDVAKGAEDLGKDLGKEGLKQAGKGGGGHDDDGDDDSNKHKHHGKHGDHKDDKDHKNDKDHKDDKDNKDKHFKVFTDKDGKKVVLSVDDEKGTKDLKSFSVIDGKLVPDDPHGGATAAPAAAAAGEGVSGVLNGLASAQPNKPAAKPSTAGEAENKNDASTGETEEANGGDDGLQGLL